MGRAPSTSASSRLRQRDILLKSPAHFWAKSPLNPNRVEKTTAALDFGRAAHAWVLGEPEFNKYFIVSPYDDFRTKDARAWRDEQTRTIVRDHDLDTIREMARAIKETPQTAHAFGEGEPEISIIWKDEETGIWLKARPDWLPKDPTTHFALEYKTCASIDPRLLASQVFRLGYDMQGAMIVDGIQAVTGKKPLGLAHICQEKEEPFLPCLTLFSPEAIAIGRTRYQRALAIFAHHLKRHQAGEPTITAWPGYTTEPSYFQVPLWVTQQVLPEDPDYEPNGNSISYADAVTAI